MRRARIAWRLARLIGLLIVYVPLHYAWLAVVRRSPWPSRFLGAAARAAGVRLTIVGRPLRRDAVVVSNHQSWLDILILGGATGSAFVAKAELEAVPVVGWMCDLNRTIYVRREDRRAIPAQLAAIRAGLAAGPVAIFPEGTTGDGRTLLPFKGALLQVLDPPPPGVRVQPVMLDYGAATTDIAWVGGEHGRSNALRVLGRRGRLSVTLHCLAPLAPEALGGRKAIAAAAQGAVAAALEAVRAARPVIAGSSRALPVDGEDAALAG